MTRLLICPFVPVALLFLLLPCAVLAQDRSQPSRGDFFIGGSLAVAGRGGEPRQPLSFYSPRFPDMSVDELAPGLLLNGAIFVSRRWSLGGETVFAPARSAPITERWTFGHFGRAELASSYAQKQSISALVVRHHFGGAARHIEPLGGMAVTRIRQTLSDRHGTSWDGNARYIVSINPPDTSTNAWRFGVVGGFDALVPVHRVTSITTGIRLHWMRRESMDYQRAVPDVAPFLWQFTVGVRWLRESK